MGIGFKHETIWFSAAAPYQILGQIQTFSPPLQSNSWSGRWLREGTASCFLIPATHSGSDSPENLSRGECRCLQQTSAFPAADSYPRSLLPQGAGWMTTSFHISQGQRHVSCQPAHQNNARHARYNPRCWRGTRRVVWPMYASLLQRCPAQLKDLLQMKGCAWRGEGRQGKNGSVPPSSSPPLAASTTHFMGGSKNLVVDSYAIGFLV